MRSDHTRRRFYHNPKILIPALALAVLLTATAGTLAWLRYVRSLQTVTRIHVSDLYLEGPNGVNTTAINLGSIGPGPNYYAFGVKSNVPMYKLQLAYTTNLPLSYSIYPAAKASTGSLTSPVTTIDGFSFYYSPSQRVTGGYLNSVYGQVANTSQHDITYKKSDSSSDVYSLVQKNAEPVYWQSEYLDAAVGSVDYYVLEVSWNGRDMQSNKETDMIYLTAGSGS